jgi:hypothetical protein
MRSPDITDAILAIYPASSFKIDGQDLSTLVFLNDSGGLDIPTQKEIDDAIIKINLDRKAKEKNDAKAKQAILDRLGITADEAKLLLA